MNEPSERKLEPGDRLDRYELLCPIAQGGMASVWLARQHGKHGFEKLVAVKTILPLYAADLRFQKMFLDEARIASGITHPNVAQILDLGEEGDVLYLAMEWVDGDSLSKLFRAAEKVGSGTLPVGIVCRILADTCAGLHAAHELRDKNGELLNVVHRDVSPQNILVSTRGEAKLIDFGIAKARDRVAGDTNTGLLKGKILYMAPEQALGKPVDRRADVWGIGAVLYHLLAGVPPFEGANQLATLHLLTTQDAPPPLPAHVPNEVREIIARTLVRDVDQRVGTAEQVQRMLEAALVTAGKPTLPSDVAAFVSKQLTERGEARRKAVELALDAARQREALHKMLQPAERDSASGVGALRTRAASTPAMGSTPSGAGAGASATTGDGTEEMQVELPSSATLGSAALVASAKPPTRNRRIAIVGGVLGVCALVAAMAVGVAIAKSSRTGEAATTPPPPTEPTTLGAMPTLPIPRDVPPPPSATTATTATATPMPVTTAKHLPAATTTSTSHPTTGHASHTTGTGKPTPASSTKVIDDGF